MNHTLKVFGLGGTIQDGFRDGIIVSKYTLDEVIESVFRGERPEGEILTQSISNRDSNNHTDVDVYSLISKMHAALLDPSIDGILVGMGTDRLADMASLVQFSIRPLTKPVAFFGSMRTMEHEKNDVYSNVRHAVGLVRQVVEGDLFRIGEMYPCPLIVLGNCAVYAHSAFKIRTNGSDAFVCAWDNPAAIFHDQEIEIRRTAQKIKGYGTPHFYPPKLHTVQVEHIAFGYRPDISKLLDGEAIVYIGTGDGNVAEDIPDIMALLSDEYHKPQIVCSCVPLRQEASRYEAGIMPPGVIPSVLPVTATVSKLAVILRAAQHLHGKAKQEYVLRCFGEDMAHEYAHLEESIGLANRAYAPTPRLRPVNGENARSP